MPTYFTCPHCGKPASTDRTDLERVSLGNGLPDALFPPLPLGSERHVDQRMACPACYAAHGKRRPLAAEAANPKDPPHPFGTRYHREVRLANPVGHKP
jgi:rubredoxin